MRAFPSIVPLDPLDREIYLVLEDFGARAGCAWCETDEQDTDRETVLRDIISGQYAYPGPVQRCVDQVQLNEKR